jgi:hypothetical protein
MAITLDRDSLQDHSVRRPLPPLTKAHEERAPSHNPNNCETRIHRDRMRILRHQAKCNANRSRNINRNPEQRGERMICHFGSPFRSMRYWLS